MKDEETNDIEEQAIGKTQHTETKQTNIDSASIFRNTKDKQTDRTGNRLNQQTDSILCVVCKGLHATYNPYYCNKVELHIETEWFELEIFTDVTSNE